MKRTISLGLVLLVMVMSVVPVYSVTNLQRDKEVELIHRCIMMFETIRCSNYRYPHKILYSKDGYTGHLYVYRVAVFYDGSVEVVYYGEVCRITQH